MPQAYIKNVNVKNKYEFYIKTPSHKEFTEFVGTTMPISLLKEEQVKVYHEDERQQLEKTLDMYIRACGNAMRMKFSSDTQTLKATEKTKLCDKVNTNEGKKRSGPSAAIIIDISDDSSG
ncbi:U-box domain-containing protein 33-like [Dorcoceras hygrometricum]|uniref:U-box domain-containing protein 33-like n=1 Tax=Dorcoceras hygrometricum TaxID=472368 RepID=A0A2Z7B309_9LAMI|nr:U-box domain-containing protein 33-like [Dorcoceras hygrometricum]